MATVWRKELKFSLCVYVIFAAVGFVCCINPPMKLNWRLPFFPLLILCTWALALYKFVENHLFQIDIISAAILICVSNAFFPPSYHCLLIRVA